MGELERDEAYRRLRAADPAAHAEPDLDGLLAAARLRAGLESAVGSAADQAGRRTPGWEPAVASAPEEALRVQAGHEPRVAPAVDLAARRRRRARVWQIAAGFVTVAVVGAGGYGLGARSSSSATSQVGAPEAASMADSALKDAAGTLDTDTDTDTGDTGAPQTSGPRLFVADGVSQDAGTGNAYSLGGSTASATSADAFAQAWQVSGDVVEQTPGTWTVSGTSGDWLSVTADGDVTRIDFSTPSPDGCSGADCGTRDGARSGALAELATAGVDTGALAVEVTGDAGAFTVTALQRADGAATTLGWTVQVATGGITSISGTVAEIVPLGSYALLSPAQAVLRLNDARFTGWAATMASDPDAASSTGEGTGTEDGATSAVEATPGAPVPWPVTTVRIVHARLGLALTSGAHQVLVPAYELTDDSGATYVVPALTDDALEVVDR